jgi:hypothetical protein
MAGVRWREWDGGSGMVGVSPSEMHANDMLSQNVLRGDNSSSSSSTTSSSSSPQQQQQPAAAAAAAAAAAGVLSCLVLYLERRRGVIMIANDSYRLPYGEREDRSG